MDRVLFFIAFLTVVASQTALAATAATEAAGGRTILLDSDYEPLVKDPEEFFRNLSWILPIEKPLNPSCEWMHHRNPIFFKDDEKAAEKVKLKSDFCFRCPPKTPVRAAANGKVLYAGWCGGYGKVVIIDHGEGLSSLYAHLSKVQVEKGDTVVQGKWIGVTGSTGFGTGGRFYFGVLKNGRKMVRD